MRKHKGIKEQLNFESLSKDDEQLYELLFEQLDKEKELSIKPNFSASVLVKLRRKHKLEARRDNLMFALAIFGVLFFSFGTLKVISSFGSTGSFLSIGMLMPLFGLAALIITFQLIDHNLVKKRKIKRHLGI